MKGKKWEYKAREVRFQALTMQSVQATDSMWRRMVL